jgi:hypothetical protein
MRRNVTDWWAAWFFGGVALTVALVAALIVVVWDSTLGHTLGCRIEDMPTRQQDGKEKT